MTNRQINIMIIVNTSACVAATTTLEPRGGRLTKIPGVSKKKRKNDSKHITTQLILSYILAKYNNILFISILQSE